MSKISGYTAIANASVLSGVETVVVDPNDTSMAPTGTDKKMTLGQQLLAYGVYYVAASNDTSGVTDTANIQAALLSFGTLGSWSQGAGGRVLLGGGQCWTNKPLIIPSGVTLTGNGVRSSQIRLVNGSNCDIIQFAAYNSSAQAAILGVSAASIANAFYAGIEKLSLHGDSFGTTVAGYRHGISHVTTSTSGTDPGDPDFDPQPTIRDMLIEACTGDGIFVNARGGTLIERVTSEYNNGNGFTPGFDTTLVDCLANANNICGFYMNHFSDCGTGCKSYLSANGSLGTWVSGHSYTPGNVVLSAGIMYFCILATSGTTAPASDATHWTALSATSPQAWGAGFYWDSNAGEHNWAACDGQQNLTADYYFNGCKGNTVIGSTDEVNFPNVTNPNGYTSVVFNNASGNTAILNSTRQTGLAGLCAVAGTNSGNTVRATTDGTGGALFTGSLPAYAMVNGSVYSSLDIAGVGQGLKVAEGSNAKQGTVTLNGTTNVVVSNTSVTASSRIFLTIQSKGGVTPGVPYVVSRTAGTSFTVVSTVASDNSVLAYEIIEPG